MPDIRWSREDLCRLVAGSAVFARTLDGGDRTVPAWLADAAGDVWQLDSPASIEAVHPDDRTAVVDGFVEAVGFPGAPVSVAHRCLIDGVWHRAELVWLVPGGHGVDGVTDMIGSVRTESAPLDTVVGACGDSGDASATNWLLLELDASAVVQSARGRPETLGIPIDELVGQSTATFVHPDAMAESVNDWLGLMNEPGGTRVTRRRWLRADGEEVWIESSYLNEGDGRIVAVLIDIGQRVAREREVARLNEQLRWLAERDGLTGLLNRTALDEALTGALAADPGGTLVAFVDLDGFKAVNDTHGHEAGDTVLREVGARLTSTSRHQDVVGRYGGDEFVVICRGLGAETGDDGDTEVSRRLGRALTAPIDLPDGGTWIPAASIGTGRARPGDGVADVVRRADRAMLARKRRSSRRQR